jgi:outer membrane receptor for ferrienterochelin and colicin
MSKLSSYRSLCALMLMLVMAFSSISTFAQSQASSGQIAGTITDPQGAALANATVRAVNKQTGLIQNTQTNDEGLFRIVLLPPGNYEVTIEASGFAKATANVEVTVGRTAEVNLPLSTSGVQETVNVTAGAVQVQTTRSEADAVINEKAIENLPINGRRFQDFVTLTPGAQVDPRRGQISLSGQLGIHTNVNVDGVDYNQPFFGGIRGGERSNNAFTVPQEAIKEFQVVASGYSAEFGRSTGGIVNAVTKSGTNNYHGSGFYLGRPKDLSRQNDFIKAVEENVNSSLAPGAPRREISAAPTQHQFGASFGGPIKQDKLFFFTAYEQQRLRQNREVQFPAILSITPTAEQLEAYNFFAGLQEPFIQTNDAIALLGRIDYEINSNHRTNIRYSFSDNEALNATSNGVPLFPTINNALSNNGTEKDRTHTVVGQLTSFFSSTIVNEFRGQYSRENRPRIANALEPTVEVGPVGRFGTVSFLGENLQFDWRVQLADSINWTNGNHSFKFGGEYNHVFQDQSFGFNQFGRFTLGGTTQQALEILGVGGSTANRFDNTGVRYFKQIGNLRAAYTTKELAFFGQDAWRVLPNLTINYGLRWEAQYNPEPELGNDALINLIKGFKFPSGHIADPTVIPDDTNNFGPRLGFAWDPGSNGKTVIRGYGGVYYSRTPGLLLSTPTNNFRSPAGDLSVTLPIVVAGNPNNTVYKQLKLIGVDLNNFALGSLPNITGDQVRQIATQLGVNPDTAGIAPIFFANDYANAKSVQAGVGVERELTRGFTVGADFSYVNTNNLQQNRDLNLPLPTLRTTTADPAQRPFYNLANKPIPALGQIQVRETTGHSLYRALTLRTKFQRSWGQFNAFYTLSKSLSTTDNEREAGGVQYDDAFNASSEYGPSNLDRRHIFTASPLVFLPFGIDFSAALRLRSGRPINATISGDANGDGNFNDRPYRTAGISYERNAFRNLALYDIDVRVQKRLQLSENKRLLFTAEVFNLFNFNNIELAGSTVTNYCSSSATLNCGFGAPTNPNFLSTIENTPTNSRVGKLLLTNNSGSPFQVQLGARFQF